MENEVKAKEEDHLHSADSPTPFIAIHPLSQLSGVINKRTRHRMYNLDDPENPCYLDHIQDDLHDALRLDDTEYTKQLKQKLIIIRLMAMIRELQEETALPIHDKDFNVPTLREANYLRYLCPMLFVLTVMTIQGYLSGEVYYANCLRGERYVQRGNDDIIYIKQLMRNFQYLTHCLQYHDNCTDLPGVNLLDREGRFKILTDNLGAVLRLKSLYEFAINLSKSSLFLFFLSIAFGFFIFCGSGGAALPAGLIIAAYVFASLPGLAFISWIAAKIAGAREEKKFQQLVGIKPYIEENETKDVEIQIRARALNLIWDDLRKPCIHPFKERVHELYKPGLDLSGRLQQIVRYGFDIVNRYYIQIFSITSKYNFSELQQRIQDYKTRMNSLAYTIDGMVQYVEIMHAIRELVIRHSLPEQEAANSEDTQLYIDKLRRCNTRIREFQKLNDDQSQVEGILNVLSFSGSVDISPSVILSAI